MQLNTKKCKALHYCKGNLNFPYLVSEESGNVHPIEKVDSERDLRVIFEANLKWTEQIAASVNKANIILGMYSRTIESRECCLWKKLYISMVRPHLEYAIRVVSFPGVAISQLENIQRRATKIPSKLKNMSYEDRLKVLGLTTLKEQRKEVISFTCTNLPRAMSQYNL